MATAMATVRTGILYFRVRGINVDPRPARYRAATVRERSTPSKLTAHKHRHIFALLLNDIPDRFPHILIFP